MKLLNKEQVKYLHKKLIDSMGGLDGLLDEGLLDSALSSPFLTFDSKELYPSMVAKIARIAYSLVCNHPFVDGNKRIGIYWEMGVKEKASCRRIKNTTGGFYEQIW